MGEVLLASPCRGVDSDEDVVCVEGGPLKPRSFLVYGSYGLIPDHLVEDGL